MQTNMQTVMPFYEREEDALTACVQALGGAKVVGAKLFPTDKSVDDAHRLLLDCLNPNRPEKLAYRQITTIFRMAKQIGFNAGFEWWAHECEFDCTPISTDAQQDRLISVVEESTKQLSIALATLQVLKAGRNA